MRRSARSSTRKNPSSRSQEFEKAAAIRDREEKLRLEKAAPRTRVARAEEGAKPNKRYQGHRRETSPTSFARGPEIPVIRLGAGRNRRSCSRWPSSSTSASSAKKRRSTSSRARSAVRAPDSRIPIARSGRSSSSARPASARPKSRAALAEFLFDDDESMIRIDMSEYMEKYSVSPPGRRASGIRRLRRGRSAHRSGAPPSVLRRAARRDRKGAPRRLQLAAASARRRAPDRFSGPRRRLQEHRSSS